MVSSNCSYEESLAQWQRSHPCVVCVSLRVYQGHWSIEVVGLPGVETHVTANQNQPIEQCLYQLLAYERLIVADSQSFFAEIEKRGGVVTLFALTPQGYQNLSLNTSELRRYIQQQNAVIAAMKKYYEAPQSAPADKPAEK